MRISHIINVTLVVSLLSPGATAALIDLLPDKGVQQQSESVAPGSAQDYYLRGIRALSRKELTSAKKHFNASIKQDKTFTKSLLGLAEVAFQENKMPTAKRNLLKALKIDDQDPYTLTSLGRYYYAVNQYPDAEQAFQKATRVKPDFVAAHIALGDLYNNASNDYVKAEKAYRNGLRYDPDHSGGHYALGVALLKQQKFSEAEQSLTRSAELADINPLPLGMLGYLKYLQQDYPAAIQYYEDAIQRNSQYIPGYLGKQDVYVALRKQDLAMLELEKVLDIEPKHSEASFKLGMIYQGKGRQHWDTAKNYYLNALVANPSLAAAYNNLAWISLDKSSDIDQALDWAKKANAIDANVPSFIDTLAWVYRAKGNRKNAIELVNRAIALAPSDPGLRYHLGVLYHETGQTKLAKKELELALNSGVKFEGYDDAKDILEKMGFPQN
jgi:tetratricopeptide (TPR) repeat protein